jgi:flagellar biosynthetic protein FliR
MTISIAGTSLMAYLLASLRVGAWLMLAPPFGNRSVPAMAKVVLALGISFAIAPTLATQRLPSTTPELLVVAVTQLLIGAGMGFLTLVLFAAIAAAGSLVDIYGGFQLAAAFDPMSMNTNSVFGRFYEMITITLLVATGGHLLVLAGLLNTFHYLPLMASPDLSTWGNVLTTAAGMLFSVGVQIALPMVAVLFIADLSLALLTKVAPAMNAITMMFPVKIGLTLLLVGLSFPVLPHALSRLVDLVGQATAAMAGG